MSNRNALLRTFQSFLAVAVMLAAGCTATAPSGGGGNDGGGNGGGMDGGNGGGGDNGGGDNGGGGNGGGDNGGDGQDDVPIVALIMTGQNTNFSIFDDVVLVDGEDVLSAAALEYGNASGILRGHESVVNSNGMLFICSEGNDSIAVYDSFLTASGTRMPDRVVTGDATMINSPQSIAIDPVNDVLYVVNSQDENIYVFDNVASNSFDGEVEPSRIFTRDALLFSPDQVVFADGSLYVADDEFIHVFDNPGNLEGPVASDRQFSSGLFGSNNRFNISVDSRDRLILTDRGSEVFIFNNASTIDGSPTPDLIITIEEAGSLHAASIDSFDTLYAMDLFDDAVYVIDLITELDDDLDEVTPLPDRIIKGPSFDSADRMFLYERLP